MADSIQTENFGSRPFHRAYINRKLPCPHISCKGEAGKVFFEEKGLAQHFRAKHVGGGGGGSSTRRSLPFPFLLPIIP